MQMYTNGVQVNKVIKRTVDNNMKLQASENGFLLHVIQSTYRNFTED